MFSVHCVSYSIPKVSPNFNPKRALWIVPILFYNSTDLLIKMQPKISQILSPAADSNIPLPCMLPPSLYKSLLCQKSCSQQDDWVQPFDLQLNIFPVSSNNDKGSVFHKNRFVYSFFFSFLFFSFLFFSFQGVYSRLSNRVQLTCILTESDN